MKYQILNRHDSRVQFELECDSLKDAVVAAVKDDANLYEANLSRADLSGADLYGADLSRANLSRANLYDANLYGANMGGKIGKLKAGGYFSCGPQGSRDDVLMAFNSDNGMFVKTGCFTGSLGEFREAVIKTHDEQSKHGKMYLGIANLIEYKFSEDEK